MPEKLAAAVERCGIYDISSGEIFSHRTISFGGETWHILTRMADAGVDYTNRNNYIAHHLVVSDAEATGFKANPAEILAQWNGWISKWDGDPRFIDEPAGLSDIGNKNTLPAANWEKIFGNPAKAALLGKAGVQISAATSDARTLLDLFSESLLLNINPLDAWDTTFTTSFSASENSANFLWRAVTSGEDSSSVINLKARIAPPAPDCRAAQYAATGVMTNRERMNLKVGGAPRAGIRYNVVEVEKSSPMKMTAVYAVSAIVTVCALLFAGYVALETIAPDDGDSFAKEKPQPLPQMQPVYGDAARQNAQTASAAKEEISLSDIVNEIRGLVNNDEFQKAIERWETSPYARSNASVKDDILEDIGARADSLMRFSENVFALENADEKAAAKAVENVFKARRALDIQGVPRKEIREKKWKTLNDKIKK